MLRHPWPAAAIVMSAVAAVAFTRNALVMQGNRHPAPLFATRAGDPEPIARPLAGPAPRAEVGSVGSIPAPSASPTASPLPPARHATSDPIGALIRSTGADSRADAPSVASGRTASAQKALVRLGYGPLKTDGVFGATTKAAIERFERAKSLPPTGTLSPRTVRGLEEASGTAIEDAR